MEEKKGTMNTETDRGGLQHVRCSFSLSSFDVCREGELLNLTYGLCDTTIGLMGDAPELLRSYAELICNECPAQLF